MLNLTVYAPEELAARVRATLEAMAGVHRVIHLRGVVVATGDDLIGAGVEPGAGDRVVEELHRVGVTTERIVLSRRGFDLVEPIERAANRLWDAGGDSVVWEEVREDARQHARLSVTYLLLMGIAGLIAAAGVFENQPVLIVGAMALSPDLLPLTAACLGLAAGPRSLTVRSLLTLFAGLGVAVAVGAAAIAVASAAGAAPTATGFGTGVLTGFVADPSFAGAAIALAAGSGAVLSFEAGRTAAAVGVAISVTTMPAAAGLGVAIALGQPGRFAGSLAVLAINLSSLIAGGTATIAVQRWWRQRREAA